MLCVKHLSKTYRNSKIKAIEDVNLEIEDGDIFGFIGPNGAGKSTTIKCIVGIHGWDEGSITFNGLNLKDNTLEYKSQLAYVPDNPETYEHMKAIDYLNFICDMYEIDLDTREKNIQKYAKLFDMQDKLNDTIDSFSHGMKQKIVLISALVHNPKILIMDEPFVGLDPKAVFDIKQILNEMVKDNKIVFYSTHILDVAEKLCSRVAIIKNGKVIKSGSMKEIKGDKSLEKVFMELEEK